VISSIITDERVWSETLSTGEEETTLGSNSNGSEGTVLTGAVDGTVSTEGDTEVLRGLEDVGITGK
jgi:hypothetical protein